MSEVFLKVFNMSVAASWIVLVVMILRFVLKNAPKWLNCILWGIVGLRLILPATIVSVLSLLPSAETISVPIYRRRPYLKSGINMLDGHVNTYLEWNYLEGDRVPVGTFRAFTTKLSVIWMVGIVLFLIYAIFSYVRLKNKVRMAVLLRDNLYQCENVATPFVLGIFRPKIYLPFRMRKQDLEYVIAHEQAHISRRDHWWKLLGFLLLILHWFNPLIWIGYIMLCKDIELACDEKVIKGLNKEQRGDYSQSLLTCSVKQYRIVACPLAFGEVSVKDRVKSVLKYKTASRGIVLFSIAVCLLISVCFLTNPPKNPTGAISAEELRVITAEVGNTLLKEQEKYKVCAFGTYERDKLIGITFQELKQLQFRHDIKKICLESEKIKPILDKYNIRNRDILDMFVLEEGIVMYD